MSTIAVQAEEAATQAKTAVAAYESAYRAMVPPAVIAANRTQLAALIATNVFGQNSPAIAATEAQYGEMWAQDAAAMYAYAGASSVATKMTPFMPPPQTTASATTPALVSTAEVPRALLQLSSAASSVSPPDPLSAWLGFNSGSSTLPAWLVGPSGLIASVLGGGTLSSGSSGAANAVTYFPYGALGTVNSAVAWAAGLVSGAPAASPALGGALPPPGAIGAWGSPVGRWGGPVSAGVGQAGTIGRLSVPVSWATAPQQAIGAETPGLLSTHAAHVHPQTSGLLRGLPLTGTGASRRAIDGFSHRYGFRHTVMPRPPAAG